jgi:hypothetical protein
MQTRVTGAIIETPARARGCLTSSLGGDGHVPLRMKLSGGESLVALLRRTPNTDGASRRTLVRSQPSHEHAWLVRASGLLEKLRTIFL